MAGAASLPICLKVSLIASSLSDEFQSNLNIYASRSLGLTSIRTQRRGLARNASNRYRRRHERHRTVGAHQSRAETLNTRVIGAAQRCAVPVASPNDPRGPALRALCADPSRGLNQRLPHRARSSQAPYRGSMPISRSPVAPRFYIEPSICRLVIQTLVDQPRLPDSANRPDTLRRITAQALNLSERCTDRVTAQARPNEPEPRRTGKVFTIMIRVRRAGADHNLRPKARANQRPDPTLDAKHEVAENPTSAFTEPNESR